MYETGKMSLSDDDLEGTTGGFLSASIGPSPAYLERLAASEGRTIRLPEASVGLCSHNPRIYFARSEGPNDPGERRFNDVRAYCCYPIWNRGAAIVVMCVR